MSGRYSRDKGNRTERAIVRFLQERGFAAEKVSGMYRPGADITVPLLGIHRDVEVKCRAHGFGQLYDWLTNRFALIVRADRCEPLVVGGGHTAVVDARHENMTRPAAAATIDALVFSLRRGVGELANADSRRRLSELSEEQVRIVCRRLQSFKPEIATPWPPEEIEALMIIWGELK
jgi:hypothetical protein